METKNTQAMQSPTNYQSLLDRINRASDADMLAKLEERITRHYNAGTISASELKRLDVRIMERLARMQ